MSDKRQKTTMPPPLVVMLKIPADIMDAWSGDIVSGQVDFKEKTSAEMLILTLLADACMDAVLQFDMERTRKARAKIERSHLTLISTAETMLPPPPGDQR